MGYLIENRIPATLFKIQVHPNQRLIWKETKPGEAFVEDS
jgi:hypothetical protein